MLCSFSIVEITVLSSLVSETVLSLISETLSAPPAETLQPVTAANAIKKITEISFFIAHPPFMYLSLYQYYITFRKKFNIYYSIVIICNPFVTFRNFYTLFGYALAKAGKLWYNIIMIDKNRRIRL